jgi:hypothetical protein
MTKGAGPVLFEGGGVTEGLRRHLGQGATAVVWTDFGDEVLVHVGGLTVESTGQALVVSLDLEDDLGRERLQFPFVLGVDGQGRFVGASEDRPPGEGMLAARWGEVARIAIFAAFAEVGTP